MAVDLPDFLQQAITKIDEKGTKLQEKLDKLLGQDSINPEDMLLVSYELGQYNALLEVTSSINKSAVDTLKSLAQRTG